MHLSFLKKRKKEKKSGMELWQWHCRNRMEKKNLQLVCGNAIAEIGEEKKNYSNCGNVIAENERGKKNSGCQNLGMN